VSSPLKIGLVAGESSGDLLGGSLMSAIRQQTENVEFIGVGGDTMLQQGLQSIVSMERFAVNGFVEPIKRLPSLYLDLQTLVRKLIGAEVSVVVGIDFNFFNQMLELRLKRRGVPTVHYVSPSVWAWRQGRIRKIRKATDVVMTLFPFERQIYLDSQIRAEFVGHPLADQYDPDALKKDLMANARRELAISTGDVVLAVLPGSRNSELKFHFDLFLDASSQFAQLIKKKIVCVIPVVRDESMLWMTEKAKGIKNVSVRLIHQQSALALAAANVALVKSGTSTLEAMLLKTPMVVAYRIGEVTYRVVSPMLKTKYIALPNILSNSMLVPEFIQQDMEPDVMAHALTTEMKNAVDDSALLESFTRIHRELRKNAAFTAAQIVLNAARHS